MNVTSECVVKRTDGLMSTVIDDEIIILNSLRANYIGLDPIGRRVWDCLATSTRVEDLCRQVEQEYDGEARQITSELMVFLNELHDEGLLEVQQ